MQNSERYANLGYNLPVPEQSAATGAPRRESLGRMVSSSTVLLMTVIGALILMLAFLILFHENANATNGYRLRNLESERSALLLELEILNMQAAQAQALENLNMDKQVQAMVPMKNARYVNPKAPVSSSSSSSASSVSSALSSTGTTTVR